MKASGKSVNGIENGTKGSRNVTIVLLVLGYYLLQAYAPALKNIGASGIRPWLLASGYWLLIALLLRNAKFAATLMLTFLAFGTVMGVVLRRSFGPASMLAALEHPGFPLRMTLFVIAPMLFFVFSFDPYELVKDLSYIAGGSAAAYLLLIFSSGEMFKGRAAEITEHLQVRGLDVRRPLARITSSHLILPPLLLALIQEAAYRQSYAEMLGCPLNRFPRRKTEHRGSAIQMAALAALVLLLILRLAI